MHSTAVLETAATSDELVGMIDDALFELAAEGLPPFRYIESVLQSQDVDVHIWQGGRDGDQVRIVEDSIIGCVYAVIQSGDQNQINDLRTALGRKISYRSCSAVRKSIPALISSCPASIMQLSLCDSKKLDPTTEKLLNALANHSDTQVRSAAVQTMGVLGWPTLLLSLQRLRETERDVNILNVIYFALSQHPNSG